MSLNLPQIMASARDAIFSITESIAVAGVYHSPVPGAYDVATGVAPIVDTQFACSARTAAFEQREIDGDRIKAGDKKIIFKTTEVTITPKVDDYFIDASGDRWDLMAIMTEPTNSVLIMRGRAHRE